MPSNQEMSQGGDETFTAEVVRQRGGVGCYWGFGCRVDTEQGDCSCASGRAALKYEVSFLSWGGVCLFLECSFLGLSIIEIICD